MRVLVYCTVLAAFFLTPQALPDTPAKPLSAMEQKMLEIDLSVALKDYEKVRTELSDVDLRLAGLEGDRADQAMAEAKALRKRHNMLVKELMHVRGAILQKEKNPTESIVTYGE